LRRGDVLLALRWLADAADLRPDNPIYHYHLGAAYARSNQRTVAAKELARAIGSTTAFPGRQDALDLLRELQHDVDSTSTSQSNR
jgi:predicted Zn-dependent protease